ncbi:MAG: beta-lactamase family protein [Fimbriimonadaceae bacterium]|jgi:CubicO group peptidase (beta-lactamase class C family)|nr:beta-lactamase family protein [Fimbriimonadaceae bacterium]
MIASAAFLVGLSLVASGAEPPEQNLDQQIESIRSAARLVGVSVGVMVKGEVVYQKAFGLSDFENQTPMTTESVHELASVSKPFTSVAVLLLAQDEKLQLDDPVSKYFPDYAQALAGPTIRQLLNHTGGYGDYLQSLNVANAGPERTIVKAIAESKRRFDPGTKYEYSNSGYVLLGAIVAKVSGQSLRQFTRERIFGPAGMTRSFPNDPRLVIPGRAHGYNLFGTALQREGYTSPDFSLTGDGHIMSTTGDLMKFSSWIWSGKALKPEFLKLLTETNPVTVASGHGYGFVSRKSASGRRTAGHNGAWEGTQTLLLTFPDENSAIVILSNTLGSRPALARIVEALSSNFFPPLTGGQTKNSAEFVICAH